MSLKLLLYKGVPPPRVRLAGCPRSTVRDFVAIAEFKIGEHHCVIRDHSGSVKELEATWRTRLRHYLLVI